MNEYRSPFVSEEFFKDSMLVAAWSGRDEPHHMWLSPSIQAHCQSTIMSTTGQMQLPILHMQRVINSVVCSAFPLFSTIPKTLLNLKLEKSYLIPFNLLLYSQYRMAYCSEVPKHFFTSTFAVSLGLFFYIWCDEDYPHPF